MVKVGQKDYTGTITHKETKKLPYTVQYEYNDQLEAGKTNIKQQGVEGSVEVTYSQEFKNGTEVGKLKTTNFILITISKVSIIPLTPCLLMQKIEAILVTKTPLFTGITYKKDTFLLFRTVSQYKLYKR